MRGNEYVVGTSAACYRRALIPILISFFHACEGFAVLERRG